MPNHDEGGEHTINPAEAEKMKKEMEIRNAGSFTDLLLALKHIGPVEGSQGEYTFDNNLSSLINLIESSVKGEKFDFTHFTRNLGLRDKIKELASTLNEPDIKRSNADWFILQVAKNKLPMEDWPQSTKVWMEKTTEVESAVGICTIHPIRETDPKNIENAKKFFLNRVLQSIEKH